MEGRGGDLVTHQNRVEGREEAVQALGRNIRLLVSITEPLHCRNAARARDRIRKGSDTHGPPLPLRNQCHTPQSPDETLLAHNSVGTCRFTSGHYLTTLNQTGSPEGERERFPCASPKKHVLNLVSHTSQVWFSITQQVKALPATYPFIPFLHSTEICFRLPQSHSLSS